MEAKLFLQSIVESLVDDISSVEITEKHDELGILLSLKVNQEDMGSIIGKSGKTIDAIRTIFRVFGSKNGTRVNIRLIEEKPNE